jgi:hypothetical protein
MTGAETIYPQAAAYGYTCGHTRSVAGRQPVEQADHAGEGGIRVLIATRRSKPCVGTLPFRGGYIRVMTGTPWA